MRPRVLLLGGMDPSGGAGLSLDATVVALHGGQPLPVVVCLTAQNRHGYRNSLPVAAEAWQAALAAALDDGPVQAIKTGLLGSPATIAAVAAALRPVIATVPLLVDPVLSATAGGLDLTGAVVASYREHLLPLASLALPNAPELQTLAGGDAGALLRLGAAAVLQKGGHDSEPMAEDLLWTPVELQRFSRRRLAVGRVRGTGCALASAIASRLAAGQALESACRQAGDWLWSRLAELPVATADGLPQLLAFAPVPDTDPQSNIAASSPA